MHARVADGRYLASSLCCELTVKEILLGVEQNNDVAKGIYFRSSNKWDATTDILKNEHRMADLSCREKEKRPYK